MSRVCVRVSVRMTQLIGTRNRKKQNSKFSSEENYVPYRALYGTGTIRKLYFRIFKNLNLPMFVRTYVSIFNLDKQYYATGTVTCGTVPYYIKNILPIHVRARTYRLTFV